jgi:hypothetical protein
MTTAETPTEPRPDPEPADVRTLYRDPGVRNYLFAGLAGLAMVFVVFFTKEALEGGLLVVMLGVAGLVLRWTAAPPFLLCVLTYFLVFPYGIPEAGPNSFELIEGRFRIADMMLVGAVAVYLIAQYRVLGLTQQAFPQDVGVTRKKNQPQERRPPGLIAAGEIPRSLWVAGGVVLAGQVLWYLITGLQVVPGDFFPLRFEEPTRRFSFAEESVSPAATRFVIVTGMIVFPALLARLVFGYWRLRVMNRDEAGMIVQDAGWDETRRDLTRAEVWRKWGRERAARRPARRRPANGE